MVSTGTNEEKAQGKSVSPRGPNIKLLAVIIFLLLAAVALYFFRSHPQAPVMTQHVSGRIEGYETNIGAKIGGRVDFIAVREGEPVRVGQLLVQISDSDIQAQLKNAQAKIKQSEELLKDAALQIPVLEAQLRDATLRVTQSKEESFSSIEQAEAAVLQARARLKQSEAELNQAQSDLEMATLHRKRYATLVEYEAVTEDENDQARTAQESAAALVSARKFSLEAAKKQLSANLASLQEARSTRHNPFIREAKVAELQGQLAQAKHRKLSAAHDVESAKAVAEEIQANIDYLKLFSPIDGFVTARAVEPGAVVVPGQTLLSLINLDTVYLRGYIPEGLIGKIRLGQKAKIFLDSDPDKPIAGEVIQIDPQGSFTPENIYFKDDRVKQVFGIKIAIKQADRFAKPGMPADAEIELNSDSYVESKAEPSTGANEVTNTGSKTEPNASSKAGTNAGSNTGPEAPAR